MAEFKSIGIKKPTKKRFQRAIAKVQLEKDNYNLGADEVLNHLMDEAGY